jgi:tRNA A37 threonylcarbamoyladenosine synthetase subunit TsaC/SUA5/YrdC
MTQPDDLTDWAADSAEKIAQAVKQANPLTFQIPEGATGDEAVIALWQHAQEHGLRVPDDDEARQLIRRTRQGTQGG